MGDARAVREPEVSRVTCQLLRRAELHVFEQRALGAADVKLAAGPEAFDGHEIRRGLRDLDAEKVKPPVDRGALGPLADV